MATLITGAGLVGSHVARLLVESGQKVVLVDVNPNKAAIEQVVDLGKVEIVRADLIDLPELLRAIRQNGVDRIIHTASLTSDVWEHPYRGVRVNVEAFANVYEAARLEGIKRVTISSSSAVYAAGNLYEPEDPKGPIKETSALRPGDAYGTTKLLGENLGLNYHYKYGVGFSAVRYPVVIPPRADTYRYIPNTDIQRIGNTIPMMVKAALSGEPARFEEWGDMEWGFVKDIARGTLLANTVEDVPSKIYNLGFGRTINLKTVAAMLKELLPSSRLEVTDRPDLKPRYPHDIARARTELGYEPQYDLTATLAEIIQTSR